METFININDNINSKNSVKYCKLLLPAHEMRDRFALKRRRKDISSYTSLMSFPDIRVKIFLCYINFYSKQWKIVAPKNKNERYGKSAFMLKW